MGVDAGVRPVAIMWENFGPYHHDRIRALVAAGIRVVAIQLFSRSAVYDWESSEAGYPLLTLALAESSASTFRLAARLVRAVRESGARDCFFCHYQRMDVFLAAAWLRLSGYRVFTMLDSKYDDYPRLALREWIKKAFLWPYAGALAGSERSRAYLASLGIGRDKTRLGYDMIDIARVASQGEPLAAEPAFVDRPFLIVARLIPKKNVPGSLRAFARYAREQQDGRRLEILGDGPLRQELEALAAELEIAGLVDFRGQVDSPAVSEAMRRSLALLLPSTSEQFGLVVNEALANSLPVIVSRQCGAVDELLDDGVNGFAIDALAEDQLHAAMTRIGADEALWRRMAAAAGASAPRGDVRNFVAAVSDLAGVSNTRRL
jgi:L-malate glycosyltransferase